MAIPKLPKTIEQELHYYLYSECTTYSTPIMFDHKVPDEDPNWLYLFSAKVEITVPDGTEEALYAGITARFDAAAKAIQAEAAVKLQHLERIKANLLAIEN